MSEGPFASLNLARTVGDDPSRVAENRRRWLEALGVPEVAEASQVHGAEVALVEAGCSTAEVLARPADALVARDPCRAVAVRTADCLPLLLADRATGAVAAVHCGWRGVVEGVVHAALDRLEELGARPSSLLSAIGPHIRLGSFEVGPEVAARIQAVAEGRPVIDPRSPRPHADLALTVRAQLEARGVPAGAIHDVGGDTLDEADRFFSHRRDRGRTGRHLAAIRPRPAGRRVG